jgi:hypothetical protein
MDRQVNCSLTLSLISDGIVGGRSGCDEYKYESSVSVSAVKEIRPRRPIVKENCRKNELLSIPIMMDAN